MFFSKWFNKNKVDGCENMAESDQTLSDIVRGMQYCVNSSAEMIERQYMDRIDSTSTKTEHHSPTPYVFPTEAQWTYLSSP